MKAAKWCFEKAAEFDLTIFVGEFKKNIFDEQYFCSACLWL